MRLLYTSFGHTLTSLNIYLCEDIALQGHGVAKMSSLLKNGLTLNEDFGIQ